MFSVQPFLVVTLLLSLVSSQIVGKVQSIEGYERWQGIWPGTDAHKCAEDAYHDMRRQGGTANMMACATDDKRVYCVSSAVGGATGPPYPRDFTQRAKELLDQCRTMMGNHNRNNRCAEPMLVNLLSLWKVDKPTGRFYIYGLGRGTTPQYHTPCLARPEEGTHGCNDMLWTLGYESYDPNGGRSPSPPRPLGPLGPSGPPNGPRQPGTPPQSAPPSRPRRSSPSPTRHRKRSFIGDHDDDDMIMLELQIRDLLAELVDDMGHFEARDLRTNEYDIWSYT